MLSDEVMTMLRQGRPAWEEDNRKIVQKFGLNTTVGASFETVCFASANLNLPTDVANSELLSISSTSALDTGDVEVLCLGEEGQLCPPEIITLNGQNPVNITGLKYRVYRIKNKNGQLNGDLWVYPQGSALTGGKPTSDADIRIGVSSNYNQTTSSYFTVPKGYYGFVTQALITCARGDEVEIKPAVRNYGEEVFLPFGVHTMYQYPVMLDLKKNPVGFDELTDLQLLAREISGSGSPTVSINYEIILVEK